MIKPVGREPYPDKIQKESNVKKETGPSYTAHVPHQKLFDEEASFKRKVKVAYQSAGILGIALTILWRLTGWHPKGFDLGFKESADIQKLGKRLQKLTSEKVNTFLSDISDLRTTYGDDTRLSGLEKQAIDKVLGEKFHNLLDKKELNDKELSGYYQKVSEEIRRLEGLILNGAIIEKKRDERIAQLKENLNKLITKRVDEAKEKLQAAISEEAKVAQNQVPELRKTVKNLKDKQQEVREEHRAEQELLKTLEKQQKESSKILTKLQEEQHKVLEERIKKDNEIKQLKDQIKALEDEINPKREAEGRYADLKLLEQEGTLKNKKELKRLESEKNKRYDELNELDEKIKQLNDLVKERTSIIENEVRKAFDKEITDTELKLKNFPQMVEKQKDSLDEAIKSEESISQALQNAQKKLKEAEEILEEEPERVKSQLNAYLKSVAYKIGITTDGWHPNIIIPPQGMKKEVEGELENFFPYVLPNQIRDILE